MAKASRAGKSSGGGVPMAFGILWTAFSSIFVVVGLWSVFSEGKVGVWEEVPCKIERFEIRDSEREDPPFRPDVLFTYRHDGEQREGTRLWRDKEGVDDYEDLSELREALWSDLGATCRVNPDDPSEAVLIMDRGSVWGGLAFAIFGGGFVVVGVGLILAAKGHRKKSKAVSSKNDNEMGGLLGCGFFGIFAIAGTGVLLGVVMPEALAYFRMKSWAETSGEVIWSRVKSHSSDDGTTYSVDVFYKYVVDDREYRSNRWNLIGGSSSGRSAKRDVVKAHPPGTRIKCYVNPEKPWQAVVNRKLGWSALFVLFPLPFMAVGYGGLYYTFLRKPKLAGKKAGRNKGLRQDLSMFPREKPKKQAGSRRRRVLAFVGALALAAFWNGIVSVFVNIAFKSWQRGNPEWFLNIFLIPFVLIGIALLLNIPYRFLAIFSPVYRLTFGDEKLAPGSRTRLSWRRSGGGGRPSRFIIELIGQEEATYRRGSSTSTATSVFHRKTLFETRSHHEMPDGSCELAIPENAVPGFEGKHNRIRWFVRLTADVPWRPDVKDEQDLDVGSQVES